jgi:hypothetical protein
MIRLCPCANPVDDMPGGLHIFGVAAGTAAEPAVYFLPEPVRVTKEMSESFARSALQPGEIYRFTKICKSSSCRHWSDEHGKCGLISRCIANLDSTALPVCAIRPTCQAYAQDHAAACQVCPRVVQQWITGLDEPDEPVTLEKIYL